MTCRIQFSYRHGFSGDNLRHVPKVGTFAGRTLDETSAAVRGWHREDF